MVRGNLEVRMPTPAFDGARSMCADAGVRSWGTRLCVMSCDVTCGASPILMPIGDVRSLVCSRWAKRSAADPRPNAQLAKASLAGTGDAQSPQDQPGAEGPGDGEGAAESDGSKPKESADDVPEISKAVADTPAPKGCCVIA